MPPKSKPIIASITILKFKRGRATYVFPIDLQQSKAQTLENFKSLLSKAINASGGLSIVDDEPIPVDEDEDDEEANIPIPIPKPEYMEDIDIDTDDNSNSNPNIIKKVESSQLRLAIPKDKSSPYENEWIELLDDTTLSSIIFNDYDILAFAYGNDDPFDVIEAAFEE
ncbi:uncharacterized protein RJT21DRAFT_27126 [Scheffersomyces amazonensis]|uniref:uncharacterized protein n=1 Tax=Scheffersomyces amazonensis TaxID=1078765 RepID=UPI00315DC52E